MDGRTSKRRSRTIIIAARALVVIMFLLAAREAWFHPAWHWLWRKLAAIVLAGWAILIAVITYFDVKYF